MSGRVRGRGAVRRIGRPLIGLGWMELSCGAPIVQPEPGKSSKNTQHMRLMLVKSLNIMWWHDEFNTSCFLIFTSGLFLSFSPPFAQHPPLFTVHIPQSSEVKMRSPVEVVVIYDRGGCTASSLSIFVAGFFFGVRIRSKPTLAQFPR